MPGQADPVYPPGQFSPWNRASTRAAWLGTERPGGAPGEEAEPGYSALAVSDPSADATTTQTWEAIGDGQLSDGWPPARTERDWRSHTGETGPVRQRTPDGRPAAPAQPAVPRREPGRDARNGRTEGRSARAAQPAPSGPGQSAPAPPQSAPAKPGPQSAPHESIFSAAADTRVRPPVTRDPGDAEDDRSARGAPGGRAAAAGRRTGKPARSGKRHTIMMATLLLAPVLIVVLVVGGYVYVTHKPAPSARHPAAAPSHHAASPLASPSPTLGPWKHIESRALDPKPLTLSELFPAQFTNSGVAGARTVDKASTNCPREVFGSKLAAAVRKADCTQVLRASYLSTDHKIMATVGVLNLTDVAAAEHAGKVSGATEFIKQLPAAHGPTKNLSKGTGIEEAEFKGHYLILIWTEYADLRSPQGKSQRKKLEAFSTDLIAGTANVSLTNRMVNGRP